jgi:ABC-type amino acid transport substrate-binding protein
MLTNSVRIVGYLLMMLFAVAYGATAETLEKIRSRGVIEIAVYERFIPYSSEVKGKAHGVDVSIGQALADKLGLKVKFRLFQADESASDDLRNQVWKGHHLGGAAADVMLHVPADPRFAKDNEQVKILAPYYRETIAVARYPRLKKAISVDQLEAEKIGAEKLTLASDYLAAAMGGRLRESMVLFPNIAEATEALRQGKVAAVMGPRGELEGHLRADLGKFHVGPMILPGLPFDGWDVGVAVKATHTQLTEAVDKAMAELYEEGAFKRIFEAQGVTYQSPSVRSLATSSAAPLKP